ncbi:MAG: hypothetical protein J1G04_06690 [Clostridiales bacterium]|nr:hypothetical protein [Clostridiales bacterium]
MEIIDTKTNVKCELGVCKNRAEHAVHFERTGIRGRIYMCDKCMRELYGAIGAVVVPKSVETAKRKKDGGK